MADPDARRIPERPLKEREAPDSAPLLDDGCFPSDSDYETVRAALGPEHSAALDALDRLRTRATLGLIPVGCLLCGSTESHACSGPRVETIDETLDRFPAVAPVRLALKLAIEGHVTRALLSQR